MPIFRLGFFVYRFNASLGQARNPLNRDRVPGGSSGGSAAAIAAGIVPLALGTDGGGSVRIPAAHCGILGLKASFGRIGTHGHCQEAADSPPATLHVGPLAACAADLTLVYFVLAAFAPHRPLPAEPNALLEPVPLFLPRSLSVPLSLSGVRIGVYEAWFRDSHPDLVDCAQKVLNTLVKVGGAIVVPVTVPMLESVRVAHATSILMDMRRGQERSGLFARRDGASKRAQMGMDCRAKLAIAADLDANDEARSEVVRAKAMADVVESVFSEADIILTPSLGVFPSCVPANLDTGLVDVVTDSEQMKYIALS
jgi:Asp-tRNA(Asn)/Glu-tRNA(Gln) amidotransferase A subunit family amidase